MKLWDPDFVEIPERKMIPNRKSARIAISIILAIKKKDSEFIDLNSLSLSTQNISSCPMRSTQSIVSPSLIKKQRSTPPSPQSPPIKRVKIDRKIPIVSKDSNVSRSKKKKMVFEMDDNRDLDDNNNEYYTIARKDIVNNSGNELEKKKR
ncbi:hypothetical protein BPAE_0019g00010 [Botrytis paeoniae]|uniref:Uncharacterized protein n=1 Tax=Botrytis paeoniae TaxID=278948 RepID=A0A4Z1G4W6_9HELO|nr:hypothetical protein BPAE_0019g00010 [Botrytis paeoniae]